MANLDTKLPKMVTITSKGKIRIDGESYLFHANKRTELPAKAWVFGLPGFGMYTIDSLMCYSEKAQTDAAFIGVAKRIVMSTSRLRDRRGRV